MRCGGTWHGACRGRDRACWVLATAVALGNSGSPADGSDPAGDAASRAAGRRTLRCGGRDAPGPLVPHVSESVAPGCPAARAWQQAAAPPGARHGGGGARVAGATAPAVGGLLHVAVGAANAPIRDMGPKEKLCGRQRAGAHCEAVTRRSPGGRRAGWFAAGQTCHGDDGAEDCAGPEARMQEGEPDGERIRRVAWRRWKPLLRRGHGEGLRWPIRNTADLFPGLSRPDGAGHTYRRGVSDRRRDRRERRRIDPAPPEVSHGWAGAAMRSRAPSEMRDLIATGGNRLYG